MMAAITKKKLFQTAAESGSVDSVSRAAVYMAAAVLPGVPSLASICRL